MSRLLSMLAVAALSAAAAHPAVAAPTLAADDAAWLGVQQQGKGQGGGQGGGSQDTRGGRGQGGGGQEARGGRGQGGGGQEARESRGRSGGGEARQGREERGQSARGSGQGGSSSARSSGSSARGSSGSEERAKGRSSGGEARGNSGNSNSGNANARAPERGSNASVTGTERRNANATADRPSSSASGRGRGGLSGNDLQARIAALPPGQRRMATSARASERMAVGAIARGHARGLAADAFDVRSDASRVRILNRRGDLLFDMDDRRAGELGGWQLRRLGDQAPRANAPAFCRSGEGHPVQGRQWCLDKGFGLGSRQGTVWSRGGIGDVIFRNPDYRTRLDRGGLLGVLGDIVLGRLALQSVALGYDQPLTGYWVAQPEGPRLLRVRSGEYEVAEFYDQDRDDRVEVLYVVQPVW